jgi:hypothetical protein
MTLIYDQYQFCSTGRLQISESYINMLHNSLLHDFSLLRIPSFYILKETGERVGNVSWIQLDILILYVTVCTCGGILTTNVIYQTLKACYVAAHSCWFYSFSTGTSIAHIATVMEPPCKHVLENFQGRRPVVLLRLNHYNTARTQIFVASKQYLCCSSQLQKQTFATIFVIKADTVTN